MKRLTAFVPILLLASFNVQANAYCDSRRSAQEVETCYRQSLTALKRAVDKGFNKIMNSRHYSEATKQRVQEEQRVWEQSVQTNCQNYACVEYQFQGRLLQLGRMKADPPPPQWMPKRAWMPGSRPTAKMKEMRSRSLTTRSPNGSNGVAKAACPDAPLTQLT